MVKERLFLVDNTDGYLRASAMPIGVQTSRHVAQHHVGYISSMDVSCIQAAEVNELYHLAHVKVNFIVWLAAFAMGYSSRHVLLLFWMNSWNIFSLPTQAQQGNWQAGKGQVR